LLNHDIATGIAPPEVKPVEPAPGTEQKPEQKRDITSSEIRVSQNFTQVEFAMELALDGGAMARLQNMFGLFASTMRVDMEAAASLSLRHALGAAGKQLAEQGVREPKVPGRTYPPGAFKRLDASLRIDREPKNRISWMAGLLPYLGHENLFGRINFNQSWRDPSNWLAGNTLVPQFLDPSYPYDTRYRAVPGSSLDYATTHFVGIAGVGMDAAYYKRGDPSVADKRGVFGYEESAAMHEIISGRGLSNTIFMIQVPHDGITGVNPWIAGGGATLRGVPEKNSIQPFVLSKDRNGNVIRHKNKNGTFAIMTDGSVRFIDENVSDDVFKAMCTIQAKNPKGFNPDTDPLTPKVPEPQPEAPPVKEKEKAKEEPKKEPTSKEPASDGDKKAKDEPKKEPKVDPGKKKDEKVSYHRSRNAEAQSIATAMAPSEAPILRRDDAPGHQCSHACSMT
jgi:hypothetical protein